MKFPSPTSAALTFFLTAALPGLAAPENDNFAEAIALPGTAYAEAKGTTVGATLEAGERNTAGPQSVWFSWVSPGNGAVEWGALVEPGYSYHRMEVYVENTGVEEDSINNIMLLEESGNYTGEPRFVTLAGQGLRYYFRIVRSGNGNTPGPFKVWANLKTAGYPQTQFGKTWTDNDSFDLANKLTGFQARGIGYLQTGTREAGEPTESGSNSLWWWWVAPSSGTTTFSTVGSVGGALRILVGIGDQVANLDYVHAGGFHQPEITLSTEAGKIYNIAIGLHSGTPEAVLLSIIHSDGSATGGGKSTVAARNELEKQISALERQLKKAKRISNPLKRAKKIKQIRKKLATVRRQLAAL